MQAAIDQDSKSGLPSRWLSSRRAVYWCVAICSVLLTLYRVSSRDIINGDGILYIDAAKAFLNDGVTGAIDVYHWPFYSILIGLVHKLTGLGFAHAAYCLNALLLVVICTVFVRIYEEISGPQARIWIAGILILALPLLNDYRDFVIRGYGFWACMLVALYYFIRYSRYPGLLNALKWQLGMAAAILFRLEGLAFLVFAPFCLVFMANMRGRIIAHLFRLNVLYIMLASAGALFMLASGGLTLSGSMEIPNQLGYASPLAVLGALNAEAEVLFTRHQLMASVDEARLILIAGLLTLVIVKLASNTGLPFLAAWGYGVHRKWLLLTRESWIVAYFAVIGILALVPVAWTFFFLSSRYTVLPVLLISLITFQYVDFLFRELSRRQLKKWTVAAGALILILFLDGVISGGASKRNIREAGEWLRTEMTAADKIACNEARLEFYSEDLCRWVTVDDADPVASINELKSEGYAYLLIWIDRKQAQLRSAVDSDTGLELEKEFLNRKGNSVRLYRVVPGIH